MPQHALSVRDKAPYPNGRARHAAPTAPCKKDAIRSWLRKNRIPVSDDCLKAEGVAILETGAPAPTYALDELASEQGHEILRTPPSPPERPPMETCWAVVKNQMARKSKFPMAHLLAQLDDAFDSVTAETCSGLIKKVREVEDKYWTEDARLDRWQSVVSIHMTGTIGGPQGGQRAARGGRGGRGDGRPWRGCPGPSSRRMGARGRAPLAGRQPQWRTFCQPSGKTGWRNLRRNSMASRGRCAGGDGPLGGRCREPCGL
jgi:hypothetical protein